METQDLPDFRLLFEQAPAPYLVLNAELRICAVNDAYLRATMTQREQIVGRLLFDVFPDNPHEVEATGVNNVRASLNRVLDTKLPDTMAIQKYDIRRPASEGGGFEERHWSPINSPVLVNGEVAYILHRVEDVTQFVQVIRKGDQAAVETDKLRTQVSQMENELFVRAQELQLANVQLREKQRELEGRVESTSEELAHEAAVRQETEVALRRSEEQLRQAQKLEAIGRLAAGIAHDFNNLLSIVLSYSDELLETLPPGCLGRSEVEEIRLAGQRAADLTGQLLVFSRQQLLAPKVVNLNTTVTGLSRMLKRLLGEDVRLVLDLDPNLGNLRADPGQIEQVIVNLVVNARDAMPRGGTLTLSTANVAADADELCEANLPAESHVSLTVRDTGLGMSRELIGRIFEPFFTTKGPGRGTGLGLSTVFGIIKHGRGSVHVDSELGRGTAFTAYLPRLDMELPASVDVPTSRRGTETVLLVEDEAQVRAVAKRALERAGYAVVDAASPEDALRLCRNLRFQFDVLLTDVVMPQINGRELAELIQQTHPNAKTLFMSGYTDDTVLRHGILDKGVQFIQKPITPSVLQRRIREALDASVLGKTDLSESSGPRHSAC